MELLLGVHSGELGAYCPGITHRELKLTTFIIMLVKLQLTKGLFAPHEHVRDVFVLAQKGNVQENLNRVGISGHNDKLCNSSVQTFSGLVSTLLDLFVVDSLLNQVQDVSCQVGVSQGVGPGVNGIISSHHLSA